MILAPAMAALALWQSSGWNKAPPHMIPIEDVNVPSGVAKHVCGLNNYSYGKLNMVIDGERMDKRVVEPIRANLYWAEWLISGFDGHTFVSRLKCREGAKRKENPFLKPYSAMGLHPFEDSGTVAEIDQVERDGVRRALTEAHAGRAHDGADGYFKGSLSGDGASARGSCGDQPSKCRPAALSPLKLGLAPKIVARPPEGRGEANQSDRRERQQGARPLIEERGELPARDEGRIQASFVFTIGIFALMAYVILAIERAEVEAKKIDDDQDKKDAQYKEALLKP